MRSAREQCDELALDIFLAQNHGTPTEWLLADWSVMTTLASEGNCKTHEHAIADRLIAKGYGKIRTGSNGGPR